MVVNFLDLPAEVLLSIIQGLQPLDVYHLQQCCRRLNDLIKGSPSTIWRSCLDDQCFRNDLFRPGYANINSPDELKKAATEAQRFITAYSAAASVGALHPTSMTRIDPRHTISSEEDVQLLRLVPGGRFIVAFTDSSLFLLDLRISGDDKVVFSMPTGNTGTMFETLIFLDVVNSDTIRLLYIVENVPLPNGASIPSSTDDNPATAIGYEYVELAEDADGALSCWVHESLTVVCLSDDICHSTWVAGNRVVLVMSCITISWDYTTDSYAVWRLPEGVTKSAAIFSNGDYVMYICGEGIHGVRPPAFSPVQHGYVLLHEPEAPTVSPDMLLPHKMDYTFFRSESHSDPHAGAWEGTDVIGPNERKVRDDAGTKYFETVYDVKVIKGLTDSTSPVAELHRYVFRSGQESGCNSLFSTKTISCDFVLDSVSEDALEESGGSKPYIPYTTRPTYGAKCDDHMALVWCEGEAGLCFTSASTVDEHWGEMKVVPFVIWQDHGSSKRRIVLESQICPASGRGVVLYVLRDHDLNFMHPDSARSWIDVYHFI